MKRHSILLSDLKLWPYGPSQSFVQQEGSDLFENRRDFLLEDSISCIVLNFWATNDNHEGTKPTAARGTYTVVLYDPNEQPVTSKDFQINIKSKDFMLEVKVELPINISLIRPNEEYKAVIFKKSDQKTPLLSGEIILWKLKTPPHCIYTPTEVRIINQFPKYSGEEHGAYFRLEADFKSDLPDTYTAEPPQICYRITNSIDDDVEGIAFPTIDNTHDSQISSIDIPIIIDPDDESITYVEFSIFGKPFASVLFDVNDIETDMVISDPKLLTRIIHNYSPVIGHLTYKTQVNSTPKGRAAHTDSDGNSRQEVLDKLNRLKGLNEVKQKILNFDSLMRFYSKRESRGLTTPRLPLHSIFVGSPGTGKTTVAMLMGQLLKTSGVLSSGHVVVRERATLIGQFYSSESENTRNAIEEADGGILLIDEAYQLYHPEDPKDPGKFVIETLITALADENNRDWMLILCGYEKPLMKLFNINPGLRSRIPEANTFRFPDFTLAELTEIATSYIESYNLTISQEALFKLKYVLEAEYSARAENFGNARYIQNMIMTMILPAMAIRLDAISDPTTEQLMTIMPSDIPNPKKQLR